MVEGAITKIVGTALTAEDTVKTAEFENPPPGIGFNTLTLKAPSAKSAAAGIVAVSFTEDS